MYNVQLSYSAQVLDSADAGCNRSFDAVVHDLDDFANWMECASHYVTNYGADGAVVRSVALQFETSSVAFCLYDDSKIEVGITVYPGVLVSETASE